MIPPYRILGQHATIGAYLELCGVEHVCHVSKCRPLIPCSHAEMAFPFVDKLSNSRMTLFIIPLRKILRYFRSTEKWCSLLSHSWWTPPWMWEKGAQFSILREYLKNYSTLAHHEGWTQGAPTPLPSKPTSKFNLTSNYLTQKLKQNKQTNKQINKKILANSILRNNIILCFSFFILAFIGR